MTEREALTVDGPGQRVVQSFTEDEQASKTAFNAARAQVLRNRETEGRAYDIITGVRMETVPPNIPEKIHHRRNHPSLNPGPEPSHVTWKDPRG